MLTVAFAEDTELAPDVLVARRSDITEHDLQVAPRPYVEGLSPSTRRVDLLVERDRHREAGVPSSWLVDPDEPAVTVLELSDGAHEQVADVRPGEEHLAALPFPVRLAPSELVAECRRPAPGRTLAMTQTDAPRTLDDALDGLRFAMVATADPEGEWKSRPLALAAQEGGTLSFLVSTEADWVAGLEVKSSPTTVTFSDPGKNTYVALQGAARTSDDRARIAAIWNVGAASYFDGKDDPNVRVLEVTVSYGEYWDGPHGRLGQALNLLKAALGNEDAGEQGDVRV